MRPVSRQGTSRRLVIWARVWVTAGLGSRVKDMVGVRTQHA